MGETPDPWRGYIESPKFSQQIAWITYSTSEAIFCIQDMRIESLQDRTIFDQIYEEHVFTGNWKARWEQEKEELYQSYRVFVWRGEILWGYSLRDFSVWTNNWKLIECLWVKYTGRWIGKHMIQNIFADIPIWESLFAYSAQYDFFIKSGFSLVHGNISSTGNPLFIMKKS
jgi:hypothetical protein